MAEENAESDSMVQINQEIIRQTMLKPLPNWEIICTLGVILVSDNLITLNRRKEACAEV